MQRDADVGVVEVRVEDGLDPGQPVVERRPRQVQARGGLGLARRVQHEGAERGDEVGARPVCAVVLLERRELALDEQPKPVVLAEQGQQPAQVEVGEPVHVGVLLAARLRRRVGDLTGLGDRPGDPRALAHRPPGRQDDVVLGEHARRHPVEEVVGVCRGRDREQHAEVALDLADQRRKPQRVGRADHGGGDLVEVGRRGRADPRPGHEPDEPPPPDREAGQLAASSYVVGVGGLGEPGEELEMRTPHHGAAVAVVEAMQREGGGGALGDGDQALGGGARRADHEPAPRPVGGAEPGDQPTVAGVPSGAPGHLDAARAGRPPVEEAAGVVGAGEVVERPVLGVLDDDRARGQPLHRLEDLDRTGQTVAELGEGLVDPLGLPQLGELPVDDPLADLLRQRGEARLLAEHDQWQPVPFAGVDQRRRRRGRPPAAELDDQAHAVDVDELLDEGHQRGFVVVGRQAGAHRQQQVAGAQQLTDVGPLGGVDPADRPVHAGPAGDHLGRGAAEGGQRQRLLERHTRRHLDHAPQPTRVRGDGSSGSGADCRRSDTRTLRTDGTRWGA